MAEAESEQPDPEAEAEAEAEAESEQPDPETEQEAEAESEQDADGPRASAAAAAAAAAETTTTTTTTTTTSTTIAQGPEVIRLSDDQMLDDVKVQALTTLTGKELHDMLPNNGKNYTRVMVDFWLSPTHLGLIMPRNGHVLPDEFQVESLKDTDTVIQCKEKTCYIEYEYRMSCSEIPLRCVCLSKNATGCALQYSEDNPDCLIVK